MSEIEARRAANRAAFPAATQVVDEFRAHFGDGVSVLGVRNFVTGAESGWNPPPSPNCDACTGHPEETNGQCARMDRVVHGHDKPNPARVFCGYRLAAAPLFIEPKRKGSQQ